MSRKRRYARGLALGTAMSVMAAGLASGCGGDDVEPAEQIAPRSTGTSVSATVPSAIDFEFVTGKELFPPPELPMPAQGAPFADPVFHATVIRITDKGADSYQGPGISNEYAKSDPLNSDGTLLVLRGNDASWYLYDVADVANPRMIRKLDDDVAGGAPEFEPRWDAADPQKFFYLYGTELRSYDTDADASATMHDFKAEYPQAAWITTKSEGDASLDRRYWAIMVEDEDFNLIEVVSYDRVEDAVVATRKDFPDTVNFVSMDMSGEHVIVGYDEQPYEIFTRDFSSSVTLPRGAAGHGDAARLPDGRDVMVYQNVANDYICMADLVTGEETRLLPLPFDVNTDLGLHVSGNSAVTPGWVLVSTYGSKQPAPGEEISWMDEQLFMLELKENPTIWRLAHTHAYTSIEYSGEKMYFAEAFAAIDTGGTKVFFASNWEKPDLDYSEVYAVELPAGWHQALP